MASFDTSSISPEIAENLKQEVLFDNQFLGSSIYEYMFGQYDNKLYHVLFDGHSTHLYERSGQRPSIVIGRRGAGKSTYLNHLSQKQNVVPIPIKVWDVIDIVENQVEAILERQSTIDAEKVSDIWHLIFISLACKKASELAIENDEVKEFLKAFPLKAMVANGIINLVNEVIEKIKTVYTGREERFDIQICLQAAALGSPTLDVIESSLSGSLEKNRQVIVIMLDNPERFTRDNMHDLSQSSQNASREQTISGLLNLAGRMNKGNNAIQMRLCIPSEQYFYLKRVSTSKRKDFNAVQLLHWTSGEILSMAAHRFLTFLTVYNQFRDDNAYEELKALPIYTREGAFKFWSKVFNLEIENSRRLKEKPMVYLLRHSQLLPRQILDYLNKIIDLAIEDKLEDFSSIDPKYMKRAIEETEYETSSEVIDAYSYSYPEANEIYDSVLPKLPVLTTAKEIKDKLYKTSDAKAVLQTYSGHPQVTVGKERFLRLLIETGVYGKVVHEPSAHSSGYVEAEFEYTISGALKINNEDGLAMHPLFSGRLSSRHHEILGEDVLGVYPVGTHFEI